MRTLLLTMAGLAALAMAASPATAADGPASNPSNPAPITERHDTVESAVETPAEDLNIKKTPIPDVLTQAVTSPYDMANLKLCEDIAVEVLRLDDALGPDKDDMPTPASTDKKPPDAASVVKAGVTTVEPFRGVVRTLTGADAYDKKIQEAVDAGFARRGFLKGMALERNCAPPASPGWYRPVKASLPAAPPPRETATAVPTYQSPAYQSPASPIPVYQPPGELVPRAPDIALSAPGS